MLNRPKQPLLMTIFIMTSLVISGCTVFPINDYNDDVPTEVGSVILVNAGECPLVTLTLLHENVELKASVTPGQEVRLLVEPDVVYDYMIDMNAATDGNDMTCFGAEPGVLSVRAGSTITINVESLEVDA